jgi:hypothetical protein
MKFKEDKTLYEISFLYGGVGRKIKLLFNHLSSLVKLQGAA